MVSLTPLYLIAGIGIFTIVFEKTLGKAGSENSSYFIGIVSVLVSFGIVIKMLLNIVSEIQVFFNFNN